MNNLFGYLKIWLFWGGGGGVEEDGGREDGLKYNEVCLFKI